MGITKGYTGQYSDPLTGLDYYVSRYYDPVVGIFLSADVKEGNAQGMNPYAYVAQNPETLTDPSGQMIECGPGGCGGGGSGNPGGGSGGGSCGDNGCNQGGGMGDPGAGGHQGGGGMKNPGAGGSEKPQTHRSLSVRLMMVSDASEEAPRGITIYFPGLDGTIHIDWAWAFPSFPPIIKADIQISSSIAMWILAYGAFGLNFFWSLMLAHAGALAPLLAWTKPAIDKMWETVIGTMKVATEEGLESGLYITNYPPMIVPHIGSWADLVYSQENT